MSDGLFRGFDKIPYYMVIWYTKQIKYFPEEKKEKKQNFCLNLMPPDTTLFFTNQLKHKLKNGNSNF